MFIAYAVEEFSKYGGASRVRHSAQHHDFLEKQLGPAGKGLLDARHIGTSVSWDTGSIRRSARGRDFLLRNGEQASACSRRDLLKFSRPVCAVQGEIAGPRWLGAIGLPRRTIGALCPYEPPILCRPFSAAQEFG